MRSNYFLVVILLVLVHSFISCDAAVYHLQEEVEHASHIHSLTDINDEEAQSPTEIHAHQHCHCGYYSTLNHPISPEQSQATQPACYKGLNYPPDVPPPNSLS